MHTHSILTKTGSMGAAEAGTLLFPAPPPRLDQLTVSIWDAGTDIMPLFKKFLGNPARIVSDDINKRPCYHWNNFDISMTLDSFWQYRQIWFPAKNDVFHELQKILPLLPHKPNAKPAFQLYSCEVAYDYCCGTQDYEKAEIMLLQYVSTTIFANRCTKFKIQGPTKLKKCANKSTNGRITFYYALRNSTFHGKIYCKKFERNGNWYIRFEVTFKKGKLQSVIGKRFPLCLNTLKQRIAKLDFSKFWTFAVFDWDAFMVRARQIEAKNGIKLPSLWANILCFICNGKEFGPSNERNFYTFPHLQIKSARSVARRVKSEQLKREIGANNFMRLLG